MAACSALAKAMLHMSLSSFPFCASVLSMFQAQILTPKPAFVAAKQQQQHQEFAAFQEPAAAAAKFTAATAPSTLPVINCNPANAEP